MSLSVFWVTVRSAAERAESSERGDFFDGLDLWLNSAVVSDFNPDDFDFLSEEDRSRLAKLVEDFTRVAQKVDPTKPTSKAQREEAERLLMEIAKILDFKRYEDPDALRLGKLIERELERYRPSGIAELEFKTGFDHTGDPGIWIEVYLDQSASKTDDEFLENAHKIRRILDLVARQVIREDARKLVREGGREDALERWPYIAFELIDERSETAGAP